MKAVEIEGLEFGFRHSPVLRGVDLTVEPGRIHAVIGLNGAGKTTLMRAVLGMIAPHAGDVRVLGTRAATAKARLWAQVGYLVDTVFVYSELSGRDNIYASARLHGLSRPRARAAADDVVDRFGIRDEAGKRAAKLSLGNRQRVALAATFAHRPRLLILDEPTIGLDPLAVVALRDALRRSVAQDGAGVLVSSHHLDEVSRLADDITVIHRGSVIATLEPGGADLEKQFFDLVYAAELETAS